MKTAWKTLAATTLLLLTGCQGEDSIYQPGTSRLLELSHQYSQSGDNTKALCRLESAADISPEVFQVHYNLGVMHFQQGNWANAILALQKAMELNPNHPDSLYTMMLSYVRLGNHYTRIASAPPAKEGSAETDETAPIMTKEQAIQAAIESYQQAIEMATAFLSVAPESDKGRQDAALYQQQLLQQIHELQQLRNS